jgi:glucose/arabinose dehydrogenase
MRNRRRTHRRASGAIALVTVALAACGGDGDGDGDEDEQGSAVIVTTTTVASTTPAAGTADPSPSVAPATTAATTPATTTATTATTPVAPTPAPTTMPVTAPPPPVVGDPSVDAVRMGDFETPVGLAVRPGDVAVYVIEQAGRIVRFDPETGETRVVIDIADDVSFDGEQGLLGLAFTIDGAYAYLDYTDNGGDTNVAEYSVAADGTFDAANGRVLLEIDQPYANHNGGDLTIGPDGMLYVAMGDGGSGGDPERRASDPTTLLGKILRIDPTPSATAAYTIPADNPFVTGSFDGVAGAPEVWSWGLRNPWRIDFDAATGDLWIADVGQNRLEEINVVAPTADHPAGRGANFGWSAYEGTDRYNTDVPDPGNLVMPVLTYEHGDDGCSISGGAVYRGALIPELAPAYLYSDYCSGKLWALDLAGGRNLLLREGFSQVAAVRRGLDDELWVIERTGGLWLLTPA